MSRPAKTFDQKVLKAIKELCVDHGFCYFGRESLLKQLGFAPGAWSRVFKACQRLRDGCYLVIVNEYSDDPAISLESSYVDMMMEF